MHDDIIKWNHFPRYWPFVRGIHRSPVNSPHIGQWRRALMLSLICVWINGWVYNGEAGDLRRYRAHYDVIVMGYGYPRFHVALLQQSSGHVYLVLQLQRQDLSILTHWVAGIKKIGHLTNSGAHTDYRQPYMTMQWRIKQTVMCFREIHTIFNHDNYATLGENGSVSKHNTFQHVY